MPVLTLLEQRMKNHHHQHLWVNLVPNPHLWTLKGCRDGCVHLNVVRWCMKRRTAKTKEEGGFLHSDFQWMWDHQMWRGLYWAERETESEDAVTQMGADSLSIWDCGKVWYQDPEFSLVVPSDWPRKRTWPLPISFICRCSNNQPQTPLLLGVDSIGLISFWRILSQISSKAAYQ